MEELWELFTTVAMIEEGYHAKNENPFGCKEATQASEKWQS
jgi:hypothetical protein